MKLIKTVTDNWVNIENVKNFYVALDPATLSRYLVKADEAIIHLVIADDGDLPSLAKASDEAHDWLDKFIANLFERKNQHVQSKSNRVD